MLVVFKGVQRKFIGVYLGEPVSLNAMTEAGNAQQSFRKALGALKDSTTVGLVRVNSDYKDLDVAVVKATNHDEVLPKEKHVRTIFVAVSASRPRADVVYCINALSKRLAKTHNWAVALKTLIVVHRAMRELDLTFRVELVNYSHRRGLVLNLSHFRDDSCPNAWDYSAWVRSYALYLEECLECFRVLKYDIQTDRSRTKDLNTPDLLEQLPALQGLLLRLLACQAERLSEFFEMCRGLDFGRGHKYVKIEQPPASFLAAMEEYVQDAPQTVMLPWHPDNNDRVDTPKELSAPETDLETESKLEAKVEEKPDPSSTSTDGAVAATQVVDLLCLDEPIQEASVLDEKNALALAIVTLDDPLNPTNNSILASESTNWELELVTAASSNGAAVAGSKLAGGLDKLTLDSLYDNALARAKQNENYQMGMMESPLEVVPYNQYPFYASSNVAPPINVQMEAMSQQHALTMQQQMVGNVPTNPFGNPEPTNPFGNPGNPFVEQNVSSYPPQSPYPG
ncbi:ENTH/ANTH/VHS superfamily protein [Actinidia rufa]|uniref:ENTH/ANTH/VHS superfamily protein n=1 Tax=Actinidia rufa TaxID=165716 RepID=A0A7J0DIR3_9ERIC|nr:ENTH/ANTH/VHS superfamily protein [Actinidia rufa]